MLKQTANLPPHSAIFWNTMVVDAAGVAYEGDRALTTLYATANAPIFTHDDSFFGREILGGPMLSARVLSKEAGAAAVRLLGGENPGSIKVEPVGFAKPMYDWRELQRWGISEGRLPSDSEVYFREPTTWDKYRTKILFVCALILLQTAMISGLLYQRRRRQIAEVQLRQRMTELAHANRYSMAGELAATISHELNQPLGAILINSETLDAMLQSPAPNLSELREIIADIRRDDQRASDVIRHLRTLLKKSPLELNDIDLNDPVRETVQFFSALAVARSIDLNSSIAPMPLPVRANRIQVQQVILNLIVNALDAMSTIPEDQRKLTIVSARVDKFAEVSVYDTGPGIAPDKLKEIFDPFFSTKEKGMGMGLSIARTIVEAHGGQLTAENRAGRGATFRMRLPLVALPK
jgi:signal transduction histidine kinase